MTMQLKAVFEGATEKKLDDGRKIFKGIATSLALDRYKEVVLPRGMNAESFTENPVLLYGHDMKAAPIGQVLTLDESDTNVVFEFVFDDSDEEAQRIQKKYENGTMRTFSIGFLPKAWTFVDELRDKKGNLPAEVELEVGEEGDKYMWDTSQYKEAPGLVFTNWELLEISAVSVPANPEAHLLQLARNLVADFQVEHPEQTEFIEDDIAQRTALLSAILKDFSDTFKGYEVTGVVKHEGGIFLNPIDGPSWDAGSAQAKVAKWASEDGSGDKDQIHWGKYSKAFAYFDVKQIEAYTSYQLQHHTIDEDGKLVCDKEASCTAMATLLAAQDLSDLEIDGKAVYDHLATHLISLELSVPEWGAELSEDEVSAVRAGTYEAPVVDTSGVDTKTTKEELTVLALRDTIEAIGSEIRDFAKALDERLVELSIKSETQTETIAGLIQELTRTASSTTADDPPASVDDKGKDGVEEEKSLEALNGILKHYTKDA